MSYQSLYRRYRPRRFSEVRGQEHLVRALRNAVVEDRLGHAYLFSGPRGTGKTSTARILAKVLNCESPVDGEPCGVCASCVAIDEGSSFDVFELDAASHNKVEDIRDLINKASLGTPGRTKVYILDEVHMLSAAASNALLKTLEEPPEHVVFVLATTDPQKVLPTIKSRTQHFEVHLLPAHDLAELVDFVVDDAGLDVDAEGREYVLRVGAGSARDTLSALDQVAAAGGIPDDLDALDELVEALCERDTARALLAVESATNQGRSPRVLGEALIARLRDVFLAAVRAELTRLSDRERARVADQASRLGAAGATRALEVLGDAFVGIADAPDPRVPLEVALVRLTKDDADHSIEAVVARLERLERAVAEGGSMAPSVAPAPAPPGSPAPPQAADAPGTAPASAAPSRRRTMPSPAPDRTPPATSAPATPAAKAGGPAAAAREVLARKNAERAGGASKPARGTATSPTPPPTPPPPTSGRTAKLPAAAGDAPTRSPDAAAYAAEAAPSQTPAPTAAATDTGGAFPSLDQLTQAWADTVLGSLSGRARSRFAPGRFLSSADGVAVFGLPNAIHAAKCEEVRADVEAALAAVFGRPVPVQITVDGDAPPPSGDPVAAAAADLPDEADVDVSTLVDADDTPVGDVDRVTQFFPGAEVVEG
jgi:DNA polymerase-3 subunit gamma/tau